MRHEVEHLGTHNLKQVALPGLQVRRILDQEEQDVLHRLLWELWRLARALAPFLFSLASLFIQPPEVIILAGSLFGLLILLIRLIIAQEQVIVHMLLDRERGVKQAFNLRLAMIEFVLGDALGVDARLIDHAARRVLEVGVVFEEIGMAEDVRRHEGILQQVVHLHQEGVAGISVHHHLVDFTQPQIILHLLPVICLAMRPMAEAARQAIGGKLIHDRGGHQLKMGRERIESKLAGLFPGAIYRIAQSFNIA